jgi:hypothetical protein
MNLVRAVRVVNQLALNLDVLFARDVPMSQGEKVSANVSLETQIKWFFQWKFLIRLEKRPSFP